MCICHRPILPSAECTSPFSHPSDDFCPSYPLLHRDLVVVADGVFSQEVKLYHILLVVHFGVQFDVLHPERATADSVCCLAFLFLVTRPQRQLQDKHHTLELLSSYKVSHHLNIMIDFSTHCFFFRLSKIVKNIHCTLLTLSMKYRATALCLILISLDFQSSLYWFRMRSTHFFNRRAVSYFCQSFSPCVNIYN